MKNSILINVALAFGLVNMAWSQDKELAEKQISEQIPILQKIVANYIEGASVEINGTSLEIRKNTRVTEKLHPVTNPNGAVQDIIVRDIVPAPDGVWLTYGVKSGPYSGNLILPAWPDMPDNMIIRDEGYRNAASAISVPEEEISVVVTYRYGSEVSPTTMRTLYEDILKEAGSFRFGRTFFKALTIARRIPVGGGAILDEPPGASYKMGYVLRKNGGAIHYGQLPDLSTASTDTPPIVGASPPEPPAPEKTSTPTLTQQPAPSPIPAPAVVVVTRPKSSPNWPLIGGIALAVLAAGAAALKFLRKQP